MVSLDVEETPRFYRGKKKSSATIITASFMRAEKVKSCTKTTSN